MHGNIGQQIPRASSPPSQSPGNGGTASSASSPAVGKSSRPDDDPRTRPYVEG